MLHALIMAGGGGTRFWPRSRQSRPKQFLTLTGDRSLLQQACDRIEAQVPPQNTWVITAAPIAARHPSNCRSFHPTGLLASRAVAIPLPALALVPRWWRDDPTATMLVMPADHVIEPVQEFNRAVRAAEQSIEEHPKALLTFGIVPTFPATGYGYIHRGAEITQRQGIGVYRVNSFREKPSFDVAERFVSSGEYYWNSGIFVWKATTILDALRPPAQAVCRRAAHSRSMVGPPARSSSA